MMSVNDRDVLLAIQPELISGETVLWAGRPSRRTVFSRRDLYLIPVSLLWGGFAIFWEGSVAGLWGLGAHFSRHPWHFGLVWGAPFLLIGQYLIWGRFLYAAWKKTKTYYAITNQRAVVIQIGWRRQTASAYIATISHLYKDIGRHGVGTLRFTAPQPVFSRNQGWSAWDTMSLAQGVVFIDVEDVNSVYELIVNLQSKANQTTVPKFRL